MNLNSKLLQIQESVDKFIKDGNNTSDKYDYVTSDQVLSVIRPKLNELHLLLLPTITGHHLTEGQTKSGTTRFMTEIDVLFTWIDCDSGEERKEEFYAQGVDLAGEKGVGKALTYAEKYYLMKAFHVPTSKDDPDSDGRTASGEKKQRGTQAGKETADLQRKSVRQLVTWFSKGDEAKIAVVVQTFTKNEKVNYAGVSTVDDIADNVLPVVYAKMTTEYKKRTGNEFKLSEDNAE